MRPFITVALRRIGGVCGVCALLALLTSGCGAKQDATASGTSAAATKAADTTAQSGTASPENASSADMKQAFSQKSFDINNVPLAQRDKVRAMMQQNAGTGPSAPGAAPK